MTEVTVCVVRVPVGVGVAVAAEPVPLLVAAAPPATAGGVLTPVLPPAPVGAPPTVVPVAAALGSVVDVVASVVGPGVVVAGAVVASVPVGDGIVVADGAPPAGVEQPLGDGHGWSPVASASTTSSNRVVSREATTAASKPAPLDPCAAPAEAAPAVAEAALEVAELVPLAVADAVAAVLALLVWPSIRCSTVSELDTSRVPSIFSLVLRSPEVTATVFSTGALAADLDGALRVTANPAVAAPPARMTTNINRRAARHAWRGLDDVVNSIAALRSGVVARPAMPDRDRPGHR